MHIVSQIYFLENHVILKIIVGNAVDQPRTNKLFI